MDLRAASRRVGIAAAVVTVIALVAPYAFISGEYATQLAAYYASGAVGWGGIALFALLSAVVIASVEQGNVDPGTLAGVAVVLGIATTASAASVPGSTFPRSTEAMTTADSSANSAMPPQPTTPEA